MQSSSSSSPIRRSARIANKPKVSYKEESWSFADAFRTPVNKRSPIQHMLVNEAMMNMKKAQEVLDANRNKELRELREFYRILNTSTKYTPCLRTGCACNSSSSLPPPSFGASASLSAPITKRKEITAPSAIVEGVKTPSAAVAAPSTPPQPPKPSPVAPPAPQKSAKDILREAMKRMNEAHPEENFQNLLHPMAYGTPYPGYDDEDFDEDECWDEEELSEEEVDRIMTRNGF
jgi:hypothetical protein